MRKLQRLLFHRDKVEQELDEELCYHLERETQANLARGMAPGEARRKAMLALGGLEQIKEDCRDQRATRWLESFLQDVRYGFRMLCKNPFFTAMAIITLALGIGANTAIFSLVYSTLLKPLPYRDPDRMITFRGNHSLPDALDINRASRTLQDVSVFADWPLDWADGSQPEQVHGALIGGDVFRALGVEPARGRYLTQQDNLERHPVVVISDGFWHRFLAADPNVLGRKLTLSGNIYSVVGVMPSDFRLPLGQSEVWIPFTVGYPEAVDARGAHFTYPIGRLRHEVTFEQAQTEMNAIGAELGRLHPDEARTFVVMPMRTRMTQSTRTPLLVLYGAVCLVLFIAFVNFGSLLITRTAARKQEFQVRMSLGAGRWRLLRQIVTESVVISALGALAGIVMAELDARLLLYFKPESIRTIDAPVLNISALAFAIALSLLGGIIFGLAPVAQLFSSGASYRTTGRTASSRARLRATMVVVESAVALVLLTGSGLLIRSFWKLLNVDPGFNPDRVLTARLNLPASRYQEISTQVNFLRKLDQELRQFPDAESAGLISELPVAGMHMEHNLLIQGRPAPPVGQEPEISAHEASPDYFKTMQIPVLSGRVFDERDQPDSTAVALISRSMAEQYWPNRSPLGAQIRWARDKEEHWLTIVGVVENIRHDGLDDEAYPAVYQPFTQKQMAWNRFASIVVRTKADDPASAAEPLKKAIWKIDPLLPVTYLEPMSAVMNESVGERRFNMLLFSMFAALALGLAVIGIYGITSFLVTQRTREIGIRMALGARPQNVVRMMISHGMRLSLTGVLLGAIGAFALSRVAQGLLFQVGSSDPLSFLGAAATLAAVAGVACYIPARRAARIDPMQALRLE